MAIFALCACKPTESGYRRAYEKTVGAGDNDTDQIFTPMGADLTMQKIVVGNDTADCASAFVSVTPGIGNPPTRLKPFCVVAGGFRQKFIRYAFKSMSSFLGVLGCPGLGGVGMLRSDDSE